MLRIGDWSVGNAVASFVGVEDDLGSRLFCNGVRRHVMRCSLDLGLWLCEGRMLVGSHRRPELMLSGLKMLILMWVI